MSAIIFSMKPGSGQNAEDAIEFLKSHPVIAWGSNFNIDPEKFMTSESNPLTGYINYEGKVRYKVNIIEIQRSIFPRSYDNSQERPQEWAEDDTKFKTFFRYNKIEEIGPLDTTLLFKRPNGENVKHPIMNYVEVLDL